MGTWLTAIWDSLRSSFWFVPSLFLTGALTLAMATQWLDSSLGEENRSLDWLRITAPAARATLSTLSGALITVTGVVFSVTMLTLTQTTSQFGSRLIRTFSNQNVTQMTLGSFIGSSLYCLLILRSITEEGDAAFVPHVSVAVALACAIACLFMFLWFMQHVSRSLQAQLVVVSVAKELDAAIETLFPERIGSDDECQQQTPECRVDPMDVARTIGADMEGYLQAVDTGAIMDLAIHHDLKIELKVRPGDFVTRDSPLARVCPSDRLNDTFVEAFDAAFVTGSRRTPRQDVECAIDELVEVAVRALSPGINDPFTAITCVDYLSASLSRFAQRRIPSRYRFDEDGVLRVSARAVTFADALNTAFDQIRQFGSSSVPVLIRMMEGLDRIAARVHTKRDRDAILRQAKMAMRAAERNWHEENDRNDLRARFDRIEAHFGQSSAD